ncbi:hypothetical protein Ancab_025620 [Ancistrocladus abbreviatus]
MSLHSFMPKSLQSLLFPFINAKLLRIIVDKVSQIAFSPHCIECNRSPEASNRTSFFASTNRSQSENREACNRSIIE